MTPTSATGDDLKYGPFANACDYCGSQLLAGSKPKHIKWHERLEGKDAPPVEEGPVHKHSTT